MALSESHSPLGYRSDSPAYRAGVMTRIGLRWEPLKWIRNQPSSSVGPTLQANLDIAANQDLTNHSNGDLEPAFIRVASAASKRLQQADSGPQRRVKPSERDSRRLAEQRRIFPGKRGRSHVESEAETLG